MSDIVIKVENLSKLYRLGEIGTGTLSHDLNRCIKRLSARKNVLIFACPARRGIAIFDMRFSIYDFVKLNEMYFKIRIKKSQIANRESYIANQS